MANVFRCRDVDVSDMTRVPVFQNCDFETRGETEEEVLKQAIEHVRSVHAEPVEQLLERVFEDIEGNAPPTSPKGRLGLWQTWSADSKRSSEAEPSRKPS